METLKTMWSRLFKEPNSNHSAKGLIILALWAIAAIALVYGALHSHPALADGAGGSSLPGDDQTSKLTAAGILLRMLDTGIFVWGARIFAGLCIMSSAWALKEQRFGIAIICIVGALLFGTAPKWVQNIFEIGGNKGLFGQTEMIQRNRYHV